MSYEESAIFITKFAYTPPLPTSLSSRISILQSSSTSCFEAHEGLFRNNCNAFLALPASEDIANQFF